MKRPLLSSLPLRETECEVALEGEDSGLPIHEEKGFFMSGVNIVGVQFRRAGKIYDFDAGDFRLSIGDRVVVETERGPSLAEVKRVSYSDEEDQSLKPIVRLASRKDQEVSGRLTPEHAERFTKERIKSLDLEMRVINVEIQFGGNKAIVYFSAPGRVDFRELVKELAGGLKTRVELKQVGSRDEAKLSGGIGICGREFCCSSFLREFVPVSIKMAKNQNLALNPSKVSGGCGRLLCCLTYEDETYSALRQNLLPKGARVRLADGLIGDVIRGDILNQTMLIELDTGEQRTVPLLELEVVDARHASSETDDWGSDLDFGSLMGEGEIAQLDDSAEVAQHRESVAEPIHEKREARGPGIKPRPVGDRPPGERPAKKARRPRPEGGENRAQPPRGGQEQEAREPDSGAQERRPGKGQKTRRDRDRDRDRDGRKREREGAPRENPAAVAPLVPGSEEKAAVKKAPFVLTPAKKAEASVEVEAAKVEGGGEEN